MLKTPEILSKVRRMLLARSYIIAYASAILRYHRSSFVELGSRQIFDHDFHETLESNPAKLDPLLLLLLLQRCDNVRILLL